MAEYDIFISYRRVGAAEFANELYTQLTLRGYRAFLDLEENWSGDYRERLPQYVRDCKDFILILPKAAMDRCFEEDDMVRQEIATALAHGKRIIPLYLHGFEMPDDLPEDIAALPNHNAIHTYGMSFKQTLQSVISQLHSQREPSKYPAIIKTISWLAANVYLWRIIFFPILALCVFFLFCVVIPTDYFAASIHRSNFTLCGTIFAASASTAIGILLWLIHKLVRIMAVRLVLYPLAMLASYLGPMYFVTNFLWNYQYGLWNHPLIWPLFVTPAFVTFCSLICTFCVNLLCGYANTLLEAAYR